MTERKEDILKNLIIKLSRENNGEPIHTFLKRKTNHFADLKEFSRIFELIVDVSLFMAAWEYIRLLNMIKASSMNEWVELNQELQKISYSVMGEKIQELLGTGDVDLCSEALIALYAIGDKEAGAAFLKQSENPSRFVYNIAEICLHNDELAIHRDDIILFILEGAKYLDDFGCMRCIRAIQYNPQSAESFFYQKNADICRLTKWYYEQEMYLSLSSLMRIFERETQNALKYKSRVFEYIGIEKSEFLEKAFQNGSVKALDFYCIVKYYDAFPDVDEMEHILKLRTSASVFCVLHQCLRKIKQEGYVDNKVKQILYRIKNGMKERKLFFNFYEDQTDRGIENSLLKRNIELIFRMLCRNKQDVKNFLSMISFFNIFSNAELRLDYNITKDETVRYSDWRQEYQYICERYETAKDIAYVVMNSYLRFFVDIEEFYSRCAEALEEYWFPGLITNSRKVKLFQARYNQEFYKKKYTVEQTNLMKSPEELSYIRFKIKSVDTEQKIIYAEDVQTIYAELSNVMSKVVYNALNRGRIMDAYYYLKSFEATRQNLNRHDRFIAMSRGMNAAANMIGELFIQNAEQYGEYLRYIYFNSYLKTFVPFNVVSDIIDEKDYLLGDITLEDNADYETEAYYYISPNYYNPDNIRYCIAKEKISKELDFFLSNQLELFRKEGNHQKENSRKHFSVRVCFYVQGQEQNATLKIADRMYLHCCEREVQDMSSALLTYYFRIYKLNRRGIASNIIKKFLNAYRHCTGSSEEWFNEEWKSFCHVYLKYLHYEISSVNDKDSYLGWWVHNGCQYNINNIFVIIQNELFDGLKITENFLKYVEKDKYYACVLEDLKSCQKMQYFIYDKTILHFMFPSYEVFREEIANQ